MLQLKFPINRVIFLYSLATFGTLIACYFISETESDYIHEFPRDYTTNTARRYPEAIIFRYGMVGTSFALNLVFALIFSWMKKKARDIDYGGCIPQPLKLISIFGFFCEFWTTATIDVSFRMKWHGISAFTFFGCIFPTIGFVTLTICFMRRNNSFFISSFAYWMKVAICWFLLYANAVSFCGFFLKFPVKKTVLVSIDEWFCLYGLVFWMCTFIEDFRKVYFFLDVETFELKIVEIEEDKRKERR